MYLKIKNMKDLIKFIRSFFAKKCKHKNVVFLFLDLQDIYTKYICLKCNEILYTDL